MRPALGYDVFETYLPADYVYRPTRPKRTLPAEALPVDRIVHEWRRQWETRVRDGAWPNSATKFKGAAFRSIARHKTGWYAAVVTDDDAWSIEDALDTLINGAVYGTPCCGVEEDWSEGMNLDQPCPLCKKPVRWVKDRPH